MVDVDTFTTDRPASIAVRTAEPGNHVLKRKDAFRAVRHAVRVIRTGGQRCESSNACVNDRTRDPSNATPTWRSLRSEQGPSTTAPEISSRATAAAAGI